VSVPPNIAFHAADPSGREGYVLLLLPPASGRVRVRTWSSVDWTAPGREEEVEVSVLGARVRAWARAGWTLSESPLRIETWLSRGA
jgi:hypothetical protein